MSFWSDFGNWMSGNPTQQDWAGNDIGGALGYAPGSSWSLSGGWQNAAQRAAAAAKQNPTIQGGTLDTANANQDYAQQQALAQQILQQTHGGDTAALAQLGAGTQSSQAMASALAQQPGQNRQLALRGYGDASAAATQTGANQAAGLKAQTQLQAQDQLASLQGGMSQQDLAQAQAAQEAAQGANTLKATGLAAQTANAVNAVGAAGAAVAMASDGGSVPGKAEFGGDDPRNDTVSAKLSPGEYVVSREDLQDPDVKSFVEALKRRKGIPTKGHYDNGGAIQGSDTGLGTVTNALGPSASQPTIQNGGLLDLTQINQDRTNQQAIAQQLLARSQGAGPSVVPSQMQAGTDQNIQNALATQARTSGPRNQAIAGQILSGATANQQNTAGSVAGKKAQEDAAGSQAASQQLLGMRGQDIGTAQASQRALLSNTALNQKLSLQQLAQLQGIIGAGGQAIGQASNVFGNGSGSSASAGWTNYGGSSPDEWSNPYSSEPGTPSWASAHGGEVPDRGDLFAQALKKRKEPRGSGFMRMMEGHAAHEARLKKLEKAIGAMK